MREREHLKWSEAFGISSALFVATTIAAVVGWSVVGFFWPLIGPATSGLLREHQAELLLGWATVGLPAGTYAFAVDQPNPTLRSVCIGVLAVGFLVLAAGAAANCDGPYLFLGGGACR